MKNQYFGDIQDYRKFGLLRCLQQTGSLKLLVAWMLTPDDGGSDGRKLDYLKDPARWRRYDPELFDWLASTIRTGQPRSVGLIEESGLIPGAHFLQDPVPVGAAPRKVWLITLVAAAASADVVFLDPDVGLQVASHGTGSRHSPRYVYWEDVEQLWSAGKSLLIYQHFPRRPRDLFLRGICQDLAERSPGGRVTWFRTPDTVFLLASQRLHQAALDSGVRQVALAWEKQIEAGAVGQSTP